MFIFSVISPVSSSRSGGRAEADYRHWNENRGSPRQAGKFLRSLSSPRQAAALQSRRSRVQVNAPVHTDSYSINVGRPNICSKSSQAFPPPLPLSSHFSSISAPTARLAHARAHRRSLSTAAGWRIKCCRLLGRRSGN